MPTFHRVNENLLQIGATVRVERGPRRVEAIATTELLSDEATAAHYQEGAFDAIGRRIVLGEPMTYLDWLAGATSFYLYRLEHVEVPGHDDAVPIWVEQAVFDTEDAAINAGLAIAN